MDKASTIKAVKSDIKRAKDRARKAAKKAEKELFSTNNTAQIQRYQDKQYAEEELIRKLEADLQRYEERDESDYDESEMDYVSPEIPQLAPLAEEIEESKPEEPVEVIAEEEETEEIEEEIVEATEIEEEKPVDEAIGIEEHLQKLMEQPSIKEQVITEEPLIIEDPEAYFKDKEATEIAETKTPKKTPKSKKKTSEKKQSKKIGVKFADPDKAGTVYKGMYKWEYDLLVEQGKIDPEEYIASEYIVKGDWPQHSYRVKPEHYDGLKLHLNSELGHNMNEFDNLTDMTRKLNEGDFYCHMSIWLDRTKAQLTRFKRAAETSFEGKFGDLGEFEQDMLRQEFYKYKCFTDAQKKAFVKKIGQLVATMDALNFDEFIKEYDNGQVTQQFGYRLDNNTGEIVEKTDQVA
jgi:chemotaxis protein histidine kinase CheA